MPLVPLKEALKVEGAGLVHSHPFSPVLPLSSRSHLQLKPKSSSTHHIVMGLSLGYPRNKAKGSASRFIPRVRHSLTFVTGSMQDKRGCGLHGSGLASHTTAVDAEVDRYELSLRVILDS